MKSQKNIIELGSATQLILGNTGGVIENCRGMMKRRETQETTGIKPKDCDQVTELGKITDLTLGFLGTVTELKGQYWIMSK